MTYEEAGILTKKIACGLKHACKIPERESVAICSEIRWVKNKQPFYRIN